MAGYLGECAFCTHPVYEHEFPAFPVEGWEYARDAGGANAIHDRQRKPGVVAHQSCHKQNVWLRKNGIDARQESLL